MCSVRVDTWMCQIIHMQTATGEVILQNKSERDAFAVRSTQQQQNVQKQETNLKKDESSRGL